MNELRYTLKNRPMFVSQKYGKLVEQKGAYEALRLYSKEVDQWFEGFEKQLREMKVGGVYESHFDRRLIEQILGE